MEVLLEFIAELFFEGTFELMKNRKVPKWIRLIAGIIFGFVYGGLLYIIVRLIIQMFQTGQILFGVFFILVVLLLVFAVIACIKKEKNRNYRLVVSF